MSWTFFFDVVLVVMMAAVVAGIAYAAGFLNGLAHVPTPAPAVVHKGDCSTIEIVSTRCGLVVDVGTVKTQGSWRNVTCPDCWRRELSEPTPLP